MATSMVLLFRVEFNPKRFNCWLQVLVIQSNHRALQEMFLNKLSLLKNTFSSHLGAFLRVIHDSALHSHSKPLYKQKHIPGHPTLPTEGSACSNAKLILSVGYLKPQSFQYLTEAANIFVPQGPVATYPAVIWLPNKVIVLGCCCCSFFFVFLQRVP